MKLILTSLLTLLMSHAFACQTSYPYEELNLTFSPFQGTKYIYDQDGKQIEDNIKLEIGECVNTVRNNEYLMIAVGIENNIFTDKVQAYSINDYNTIATKSNQYCRIENKYSEKNKDITIEHLNKRLLDRRFLFNKCTQFKITDESKKGLDISTEQLSCIVKKIDEKTAIFEGFFCFVKPHIDSKYTLDFSIKDECLSEEFFANNKSELQDTFATLDFYTTGDDSGSSPQIQFVNDIKLRLTASAEKVIPSEKTILENDPKWPTQWKVNSIELGKISLQNHGPDTIKFEPKILANNICPKTCIDGICSSSCHYTQPLVGEFELSEVTKDGKKEFMSLWYDGGIIPNNWYGMINTVGVEMKKDLFQEGSTYQLDIKLEDQEFYYLMFKNQITSRLKLSNKTIPSINRDAGILQSLKSFNSIDVLDSLPTFPVFDYIRFTGNNHVGVMNSVNSINRVFKDFLWPPHITDYCIGDNCVKPEKNMLTLSLTFQVDKTDGKFKMIYQNYTKNSSLEENRAIEKYEPPFMTCDEPGTDPRDNDDDDGWDDDDWGDIDF